MSKKQELRLQNEIYSVAVELKHARLVEYSFHQSTPLEKRKLAASKLLVQERRDSKTNKVNVKKFMVQATKIVQERLDKRATVMAGYKPHTNTAINNYTAGTSNAVRQG